jgi:hypothetical protein
MIFLRKFPDRPKIRAQSGPCPPRRKWSVQTGVQRLRKAGGMGDPAQLCSPWLMASNWLWPKVPIVANCWLTRHRNACCTACVRKWPTPADLRGARQSSAYLRYYRHAGRTAATAVGDLSRTPSVRRNNRNHVGFASRGEEPGPAIGVNRTLLLTLSHMFAGMRRAGRCSLPSAVTAKPPEALPSTSPAI